MKARPRRSALVAIAALVLLVGVLGLWRGISGLLSPWPDPNSFAGDARLAACRAVLTDVDHVFEMTHARWYPRYFPGWSGGAPELEVDDPALVVIASPQPGRNYRPIVHESAALGVAEPTLTPTIRMCVAVGPPDDALIHQYGPTWFETIVPVLPGS